MMGRRYEGGFRGPGQDLFLDLVGGYIDVFLIIIC